MVSVSAQTNACDPQQEGIQDPTIQDPPSVQVETFDATDLHIDADENAPQANSDQIDAGTLAASVLQLSAANDIQLHKRAKRPELLWDDENPLEIPDVLTTNEGLEPDPEQRAARRHRLQPAQYGPSFKALLFSTLLIVVAGSGAIALGLPEMVAETDTPPIEVQTQTITTIPKVDKIGTIASASRKTDAASANQIKKATDRVRQAFAETGSPNPDGQIHLAGRTVSTDRVLPTAHQTKPNAAQQPSLQPPSLAVPDTVKQTAGTPTPSESDRKQPSTGSEAGASPNEEETKIGTVTASVNMRQTDNKNGKIISVVPEGTQVSYGTCGKWWCEVNFDGTTGYVGQKFISR